MNSVAAINTIAPQRCSECDTLYDTEKTTYLQCILRLLVASLAHYSHGSLKLDNILVNRLHVACVRDSGASVIGINKNKVRPEDITDEVIKCVTFGGNVELYKLCNIHIDSPYIMGRFHALILPSPA